MATLPNTSTAPTPLPQDASNGSDPVTQKATPPRQHPLQLALSARGGGRMIGFGGGFHSIETRFPSP